jgi:DNA-binding NarL/FixJ family response regulator
MRIKTLIVDDHQIVLHGLRSLLGEAPDIDIVGEAPDGHSAIELASKVMPDVILMDLSLPGMNGIDTTMRILEQSPCIKVLVLSMYSDRYTVNRVMEAGVSGVILKNCTAEELSEAVHTIYDGGTYFSPEINHMFDVAAQMRAKNRRHRELSMAGSSNASTN